MVLRWSGASSTTGPVLTLAPAAGSFLWYLVLGRNGMMAGDAGSATAGSRVLNIRGDCPQQ